MTKKKGRKIDGRGGTELLSSSQEGQKRTNEVTRDNRFSFKKANEVQSFAYAVLAKVCALFRSTCVCASGKRHQLLSYVVRYPATISFAL